MTILLANTTIVNEGQCFVGHVLIEKNIIKKIYRKEDVIDIPVTERIDCEGKYLLPGIIDDQVHFRQPGLVEKGDIYTESRAAAAGGVTSFMDMPNTRPACLTNELLEQKFDLAAEHSIINYSFYLGASNDNINEVQQVDPHKVCGVKVFMGSSTGNMLVDQDQALQAIFAESPVLVATHCEDEQIILENNRFYKEQFGSEIPFRYHPLIRSAEACYKSSAKAVELAHKYGTQLHVLHLSTAREIDLFSPFTNAEMPKVTAEACVHHLWFTDKDYDKWGAQIKCNPAIKSDTDRDALRKAVKTGQIAVVATDHAPHTWLEKQSPYFTAPSGIPLVQHSLQMMLEMVSQGVFSIEQVVQSMCHHPAKLFQIQKRGYIREGYYADLVLVDLKRPQKIEQVLYKCAWSPLIHHEFSSNICTTWVNGARVFDKGQIIETKQAQRLLFR